MSMEEEKENAKKCPEEEWPERSAAGSHRIPEYQMLSFCSRGVMKRNFHSSENALQITRSDAPV